MRINLDVGSKEISIDAFHEGSEDACTWGEILDELVWPALRAWGFMLDNEFTDQISEYHQEYLNDKYNKREELPGAGLAMTLRRRDVVKTLLAERGDLLVVAGLGSTSWDCTAAGDHPLTFPMWGAMGNAAMMGLGLALAQPRRRVLVVTGDGEMLMGLGSLATIGVQKPKNLAIAVIDNERYGETGMQATHTAGGVDLAKTALACGFRAARVVRSGAALGLAKRMLLRNPARCSPR